MNGTRRATTRGKARPEEPANLTAIGLIFELQLCFPFHQSGRLPFKSPPDSGCQLLSPR